jgi:hypothetical protein
MFGLFGGSQRDIYGDQAGLSGGFGGGGGSGPGGMSNTLMLAGLGLMSSPRTNPWENVMKGVVAGSALDERSNDRDGAAIAMQRALIARGVDPATARMMARYPEAAKVFLEGQENAKLDKEIERVRQRGTGAVDIYGGGSGTDSPAPRNVPRAPRQLPMPSSPSTSDSPLAPSSHVAPAEPQQSVASVQAPAELANLFSQAESKYNLPAGYMARTAQLESRLNPRAQNPNSSAGGLFQFIDSTAKDYGLTNRFDPVASTDAAARLAADNMAGLKQALGRDPTAAELYLAHQQGLGGATKILSNPDAPLASLVGREAARLNAGGGKTAGQFAQQWLSKFGGGTARPQQLASADSGFMPGPISEEEVGLESAAEAAPAPEQPVPSPQASLDPETQKIKDQYDAQIKELLGTGQMKKAEQLEAMRDSSMAQRMQSMPPQPPSPSPQTAPPIGPQIASADNTFVPSTNPSAPQDTPEAFDAKMAGLRGETAQAPARTMTDAPRMVQTTREKPMGAAPAQSQANPEAGQTPAFVMQRRAILQQAQQKQYEAMLLERRGLKAASEIMKDEIKYLYDQAKPTDTERKLLAAGVPPGSRAWSDAILDETRTAEQRNVRSAYPNDPQAQERAHREQLSKDTPAYRNAKRKLEAMGLKEGTPEFNKQLPETLEKFASAEGGQPKVESAYDQRMGGIFADMNKELITEAREAKGKIATLNRLEQLLSDPNVYQGTAGPLVLQAKRLAKSLGFDVEGVEGAEAITAIANRFALEARNPSGGAGMPGALSDKDREFLVDMGPGLGRTPEGNKHIIDYNRRLAMRSLDVERQRQLYLSKNKGRLDEGFYTHLEEWSAKNPLFNETDRKNVQRLSGGPAPKDAKPAPAEETPPPGYTGTRWKFLTPEERKLWQ